MATFKKSKEIHFSLNFFCMFFIFSGGKSEKPNSHDERSKEAPPEREMLPGRAAASAAASAAEASAATSAAATSGRRL